MRDPGKELDQSAKGGWEFCKLLTGHLRLTSILIPDAITGGMFVIVFLLPVFIFQVT